MIIWNFFTNISIHFFERIAHFCEQMSDLLKKYKRFALLQIVMSDFLMVAQLSWAIWANRSWWLIKMSDFWTNEHWANEWIPNPVQKWKYRKNKCHHLHGLSCLILCAVGQQLFLIGPLSCSMLIKWNRNTYVFEIVF